MLALNHKPDWWSGPALLLNRTGRLPIGSKSFKNNLTLVITYHALLFAVPVTLF